MFVVIQKILMNILLWILKFIDSIFNFFKILAGAEEVTLTSGEQANLVTYFLQADGITQVFVVVFLLSIILCAVCIVVAIVKNIINMRGGERKPIGRIVGQGLLGVGTTFVVALVMFAGIFVANLALGAINDSFNEQQNTESIGTMIFDTAVEDVDYYTDVPIYKEDPTSEDGLYHHPETGEKVIEGYKPEYEEDGTTEKHSSGWRKGSLAESGFKLQNETADSVFGRYRSFFGFPDEDNYVGGGKVEIRSFNFFVGYFGAIIMLIVVSKAALDMIKRLFDLIMLFLALPIVMATIPLDDGAKFQQWRETVISKIILAYGTIFAINIFMIIVSLISGINFDAVFSSNTILFYNLKGLAKLFLIIGCGIATMGGGLLFSRLMGTSADEGREMSQGARALLGGIMGAGGAAMGLKNAVFGGVNKYGRERKGLVKGGLKAANLAGTALGGNVYKGVVSGTKDKSKKIGSALKGWSMKHNGVVGGLIGGAVKLPGTIKNKELRAELRKRKWL